MTYATVVPVLAAIGLLWYFRLLELLWFPLFLMILFPTLWVISRLRIQRRLMKRVGASIQVRATDSDFTFISEGESHTLPWSRIVSTATDDRNIYLFITKNAALILPKGGLSKDMQKIISKQARVA